MMEIGEVCRKYGLPEEVAEVLLRSGVRRLYPPQVAALEAGLLSGENLVIAAPTASGKTLVAELAMLHTVVSRGSRALYLVPLRALAGEKHEDFKRKYGPLGVRVGISTGDFDRPDPSLAENDILVLTNEKADSLLRHRARWLLEGTGLVVLDEVHLLGDPARGPTLEVLVAALRRARPDLQLLALSATIGNPEEIADWLEAGVVVSDFRPVPLRKGVFCGGEVLFPDGTRRRIPPERDPVLTLSRDTLDEGGQVLVFVSTRRSAQAVAKRLARSLKAAPPEGQRGELEGIAAAVEGALDEPTRTCRDLGRCIRAGVAFHHAGLHPAQRKAVEDGFRKRSISVLCTTTTLAAGVNLPARRVIIRDVKRYEPPFGSGYIPSLEFHQMAGRAGRPGLDPYGEAILIARDPAEREELFLRYVLAPPEPIESRLGESGALVAHVLAAIAAGYARSLGGLLDFLSLTLFAHQRGIEELALALRDGIMYLLREGFVRAAGGRFLPTPLGSLTAKLYIHPVSAALLRDGLRAAAGSGGTELGFLHLIAHTPDMERVHLRSGDHSELERIAEGRAGEFLVDVPAPGDPGYPSFLAELKTALILSSWIEEETEAGIQGTYGVGPGDVHRLVETAGWLLHCAGRLSRLLGLRLAVLPKLRERVRYGVREELLDLVRIRGVGRVRARTLYEAGYRDLKALSRAEAADLARLPHIGPTLARRIVGEAAELSRRRGK